MRLESHWRRFQLVYFDEGKIQIDTFAESMMHSRGVLARYETEQDEPPGQCDTCVKEPRSTNNTAEEAAWNLRSEVSALMFHHVLILRFCPERPPNFNFTDVVYSPCFHRADGTHSQRVSHHATIPVPALAPAPLLLTAPRCLVKHPLCYATCTRTTEQPPISLLQIPVVPLPTSPLMLLQSRHNRAQYL